mmetsp:Transcript_13316/g.37486  ORF Transcript_13316/g.37486 Transcript_13316/m.37486 type:complete len:145 (+) Transcript_13316:240-674(+)
MTTRSKQVRFGDLTITEYPIILGDNPACNGAPITIGWEPIRTYTRNLELYEYTRTHRRHGRKKLVIPVQKRSQILLDAGYTEEEIIKAALKVAQIKSQREETLNESQQKGFDKFSSNIRKGFSKLKIDMSGPKPPKPSVVARSA